MWTMASHYIVQEIHFHPLMSHPSKYENTLHITLCTVIFILDLILDGCWQIPVRLQCLYIFVQMFVYPGVLTPLG